MNQKWKKESTDGERDVVTISRDYDFPRESVFSMFTDPKKAAKFFSPEGAVKLLFEWDPKPGGAIRIHDRHEGVTYKTSGTFVQFVPPEILSFKSATTPGEGADPFEALQTMKFEALSPKKTRVTVLVKVLAAGSFLGGVEPLEEGFIGGWGQTLDILQRELR
jgi:uncharacterized protein YndB with AHSA1/START domain